MTIKKTPEYFRKEVLAISEDIITISDYINARTRLNVSCKEGHTWSINPSQLLTIGTGKNCNICRGIITKVTTKQFIAEVALLSTDISIIHGEYVNANTKLNVSCKEGHTWAITPSYLKSRLTNSKCPICSNSFLNKLKEIDSTLVSPIVSSRLRHTITCKEGHIREVIPTHLVTHSTGAICRICNPISKPEQGLLGFIRSKYTGWIETSDKSILEGKELDIVLPDLGLAIEFNGDYWHSDKFRDKEYHLDKTNRVQDFGYQLIHINESEWDNKQDIVKSRIQSLLGDSYKIYAKKTLIRRIDFPKEFLETNHIQGSGSNSSYNYGLFLKDELIAVMTFSIPRFSKGYDYELIRYCSLLDITVVGGASKLLKAFIKDMPNKTIISYSDKRWSKGNLYKVLGFILDHTSTPNYRYIKGTIEYSRYQCQKHLLETRFPEYYKDSLTEGEIMSLAGFNKVFDCGNDVWILK